MNTTNILKAISLKYFYNRRVGKKLWFSFGNLLSKNLVIFYFFALIEICSNRVKYQKPWNQEENGQKSTF